MNNAPVPESLTDVDAKTKQNTWCVDAQHIDAELEAVRAEISSVRGSMDACRTRDASSETDRRQLGKEKQIFYRNSKTKQLKLKKLFANYTK